MALFSMDRRIINKGLKPWGYAGARGSEDTLPEYGLNFTGSSSYVDVSAVIPTPFAHVKLSCYIKTSNENGGIFGRGGGGNRIVMYLDNGYFGANVRGDNVDSRVEDSSIYLADNEIYHVEMEFIGNDVIVLRIDGVQVASEIANMNEIPSIGNVNDAIAWDDTGDTRGYFTGIISGFKVTANNTLQADYTFEEGSGTTLTDHSGNGNDGTINGATWVGL